MKHIDTRAPIIVHQCHSGRLPVWPFRGRNSPAWAPRGLDLLPTTPVSPRLSCQCGHRRPVVWRCGINSSQSLNVASSPTPILRVAFLSPLNFSVASLLTTPGWSPPSLHLQ
ncbi:hypothetical protein E2C01_063622 [Portunus trituberculatus]|uniref:Uncharacterized protein n=1 Tax=Portunus trituberculatus TaxID=210409 RepID=A0A5B7HI46_PORTR|nr:hypothetical protein [Portunus trituberculatus]